jgi:hypothetical protein
MSGEAPTTYPDPTDDPRFPKRFEAEIVLTTRLDGHPGSEVRLHRRVIALSWEEARDRLLELPFEDLVEDDVEIVDTTISLLSWSELPSD